MSPIRRLLLAVAALAASVSVAAAQPFATVGAWDLLNPGGGRLCVMITRHEPYAPNVMVAALSAGFGMVKADVSIWGIQPAPGEESTMVAVKGPDGELLFATRAKVERGKWSSLNASIPPIELMELRQRITRVDGPLVVTFDYGRGRSVALDIGGVVQAFTNLTRCLPPQS